MEEHGSIDKMHQVLDNLCVIQKALLALVFTTNFAFVLAVEVLAVKRHQLYTPITILIVVNKAEKVVGFSLITFMEMNEILLGHNVILATPFVECTTRFLGTLYACSIYYGEVTVSVMRLIYVRRPEVIQAWGETPIMAFILAVSQLFLATGCSLVVWSSQSPLRCSNANSLYFNANPAYFFYPTGMLVCLTELAIYVSIHHFVYRHDKSIKEHLSNESYQRRRRVNTTNFIGRSFFGTFSGIFLNR